MPGGRHLLQQTRLVDGMQSDGKEDCLGAMVGERGQYFRSCVRPWTLVKGEHDFTRTQEIHAAEVLGALISLEQKKAVGLHFAGTYGVANSAVGVTTIKNLLKGPLVTVGQIPGGTEATADGMHGVDEFKDRKGFNANFLGKDFGTPWPQLPADIETRLARPSDATKANPHEMRYTHFGVKFSTEFRLPVLTAVNIDRKNSVRIERAGDRWFFDGSIDRKFQHRQ
jgi:hypothetical protein